MISEQHFVQVLNLSDVDRGWRKVSKRNINPQFFNSTDFSCDNVTNIMTKNNNIDKYTEVGHMPLALSGLKGATLGNDFHVVGGYFDHQYYDEVII